MPSIGLKTIASCSRQTYYYVDNVTNNVAQYKFQNYNCTVTFLDKHKNASPEKLQFRLFSTQKFYDCSQVTRCGIGNSKGSSSRVRQQSATLLILRGVYLTVIKDD